MFSFFSCKSPFQFLQVDLYISLCVLHIYKNIISMYLYVFPATNHLFNNHTEGTTEQEMGRGPTKVHSVTLDLVQY